MIISTAFMGQDTWIWTCLSGFLFLIFQILSTAYEDAGWPVIEDRLKNDTAFEKLKKRLDNSTRINLVLELLALAFGLALFAFLVKSLKGLGLGAYFISAFIVATLRYLLPETYGRRRSEEIVISTSLPVAIFAIIFTPLVKPLELFLESINTRLRKENKEDIADEAIDEIIKHADEGVKDGAIETEQVEMIEGVVKLSETKINEIMTPRTEIFFISLEAPLEEAIRQITASGHSRIPVYEENRDKITGILYAKDLLQAMVDHKELPELRTIVRETYFVPETKSVQELFQEFKKRKIHLAIALDEYGGTAGLVTIEDIVEEIVGEIEDEYDEVNTDVDYQELSDGTVIVDAGLDIEELNEKFKISLPEEGDFETVGGFVTDFLGEIPVQGHNFEYAEDNLVFEVMEANERQVLKLKIVKAVAK